MEETKKIPPPPKPPLSRIQREGTTTFCKCGSTMPKTGLLRLFGERRCSQPLCKINQKRQI